ncbi:MAG: SLC13 family permease [Pseudomonadota bacterium]
MAHDQLILGLILLAAVILFVWGRWRHDFVALAALALCVVAGIVPEHAALSGFGHPAAITVAFVLILSGVLQSTGAAERLLRAVMPQSAGKLASMAILVVVAAVLSGFMNNVGALAILMPVAVQIARKHAIPPGQLLMPLAFGSILGGMTTLIGTPPNLIVSGFRAETGAGAFGMFDFTPVGLVVTLAGLGFIILFGWRLVPVRERAGAETFETGAYLTEARVPEGSKAVGMRLAQVEEGLEEADAQVIGLIRNEARIPAPHPRRPILAGDVLVIEAEPETLATALGVLELELVGEKKVADHEGKAGEGSAGGKDESEDDGAEKGRPSRAITSEGIVLMEVALLPRSTLNGRSVSDIRLRSRYGINLLAVSRQGRRNLARLRLMPLATGDVLLLQGAQDDIMEFASQFGAVPLAERDLQLPHKRDAWLATGILGLAVIAATFGLVPAAIAFMLGALLSVLTGLVAPRRFYDGVDWPVVVLLAALIPVAQAVGDTGMAALFANGLVEHAAGGEAVIALVLILVVTMTLSDFMNNAATAAVMCPIAISTAGSLGVSADPLLMAVAVGASCAFLTPIGHQNNTLILGPGGFRFGDYWRLGLPLEMLVVAVAVPMILLVWPL